MAVECEVTTGVKGNRKQRREQQRKIWTDNPGLDVVHPDAAGIDVGNSEHYVAIAPDKSAEPVRRFGCFTADLRELARFLKEHGIVTVVMQSTGVYWIPLYDVLEEAGFEVYLVNARDTKNLPGRKSDVQESQWLLKLHTCGLLRNSFRPTSEIRVLRTYWRQRAEHIHTATECVQRMQKALTQMNLQLANVIADIMGLTGQKILRAILAGERDPDKLAQLRHGRDPGQPRGCRLQSDGQLAGRTVIWVEAGDGALRLLPTADPRVRPGDRKASRHTTVEAAGSAGSEGAGGTGNAAQNEEEEGTGELPGVRSGGTIEADRGSGLHAH